MTATQAVVYVFAMFFGLLGLAVVSHHKLEVERLERGYYDPKPSTEENEVENDEDVTDN